MSSDALGQSRRTRPPVPPIIPGRRGCGAQVINWHQICTPSRCHLSSIAQHQVGRRIFLPLGNQVLRWSRVSVLATVPFNRIPSSSRENSLAELSTLREPDLAILCHSRNIRRLGDSIILAMEDTAPSGEEDLTRPVEPEGHSMVCPFSSCANQT